jgi:hypothetical protein
MSDDQDRGHELSTAERDALRRLYADGVPDPGLEDRIVAALRSRGRLGLPVGGHSRRGLRRAALRVAAAVALFAAGVLVGRSGWRGQFPAQPNERTGRRDSVESATITDPRPEPKVRRVVWL